MQAGIRNHYQAIGVDNYYLEKGNDYENPHAVNAIDCLNAIWREEWKTVLDFACGDGLITKNLITKKLDKITGCDKFMYKRYEDETQQSCLRLSFQEVSTFETPLPQTDIIVFSYAIDLVPDSYLSSLLYALSCSSKNLFVIRPNNHKVEHFSWAISEEVRFGKARGILYTRID